MDHNANLLKAAAQTVNHLEEALDSRAGGQELDLDKVIQDIRQFRDHSLKTGNPAQYDDYLKVVNTEAEKRDLLGMFETRVWPVPLPATSFVITGLDERPNDYPLPGEDPVDRRLSIERIDLEDWRYRIAPDCRIDVMPHGLGATGAYAHAVIPKLGAGAIAIAGLWHGVKDTGYLMNTVNSTERSRLATCLASDAAMVVGGASVIGNVLPARVRGALLLGGVAGRLGMDLLL